MKIVMVSHYYESHRGGIEIVTGQLARALTSLGHNVAWLASDSSPPPVDPTICVDAIPLRANNMLEQRTGIPYPIPLPWHFLQLKAEIEKADVVIIHDAFYLLCRQAQRYARQINKPVLIIQHIGIIPYRNPLLRIAMRILNTIFTKPALSTANQVVFISQLTRAHFAGVHFRREPVIIFNGVDSNIFRPPSLYTDRPALRRAQGFNSGRPTVLFVGRFVEKKGLAYVRRMARMRPNWDWVLAGWGPIDPTCWSLSNVKVLSGRSGATLAPLYQAADVLVLPSVGEGFPLVIQEALASGLPVVCGCDTATADHAAEAFLRGVLVRQDNPVGTASAFVEALEEILSAAELDTDKGLARASFARDRYSWKGNAEELVRIILSFSDDLNSV